MKIKTFEAACAAKQFDPAKILPDVSAYPADHGKALTAAAKLFIVVDALNEGWKPDWNNDDEYKWWNWFDMEKSDDNPSGFRFSFAAYFYSNSGVGSRLCFKSRQLAEWAAEHFIELYKDFFILN
ncbi:MAG TPA: hypothetical protein VMZ03_04010 [Chitinophagaceae bacterium]|nr:hypothetical protein [Chitinophagaceae bacterium]